MLSRDDEPDLRADWATASCQDFAVEGRWACGHPIGAFRQGAGVGRLCVKDSKADSRPAAWCPQW
jgi:hypothetical protein